MNLIFKFLMTVNATFWMWVIYGIKEQITILNIPQWIFGGLLVLVPILLSAFSIQITTYLGVDELEDCQELSLEDNTFLPTYLGYFFVSLGITDITTMICIYLLVFAFTFLSQAQYFNPIFLLFGYHFYHVLTKQGTKLFIIAKGRVIRNRKSICFDTLRRINDTTYIQKRGRD